MSPLSMSSTIHVCLVRSPAAYILLYLLKLLRTTRCSACILIFSPRQRCIAMTLTFVSLVARWCWVELKEKSPRSDLEVQMIKPTGITKKLGEVRGPVLRLVSHPQGGPELLKMARTGRGPVFTLITPFCKPVVWEQQANRQLLS